MYKGAEESKPHRKQTLAPAAARPHDATTVSDVKIK